MVSILQRMGRRNYLIEGLSGTGKTSVAMNCSATLAGGFLLIAVAEREARRQPRP
jgi:DNA helicase TIP49 (TBP-interacting protein)